MQTWEADLIQVMLYDSIAGSVPCLDGGWGWSGVEGTTMVGFMRWNRVPGTSAVYDATTSLLRYC